LETSKIFLSLFSAKVCDRDLFMNIMLVDTFRCNTHIILYHTT
jgi:hypothetical protein